MCLYLLQLFLRGSDRLNLQLSTDGSSLKAIRQSWELIGNIPKMVINIQVLSTDSIDTKIINIFVDLVKMYVSN